MKKLYPLIVIAFGIGLSAQAQQLQNPGFENWSVNGLLWDGTETFGADHWQGAMQTNDSYSGTYAAKVEPMMSCGIMTGFMIYGSFNYNYFNFWAENPDFTGSGAPINFKPSAVSGYFKLVTPDTNDVARGFVILKKFNPALGISEEIGRGELEFTPTNDYTLFNIPVEDLQPGVMPDSVVIAFSSGMGYSWDSESNILSYGTLYVDQLRVQENVAAVNELVQMTTSFFPNPASGQLNYSFETTVADQFSLVLIDAAGRIVYSEKTEPKTQHTIDLSTFSAGTYHAQIRSMSKLYADEMIVIGQ
ncbi:MAG TPA: T9SS type A sorting domain-containing protein [Fluviicola sp.]|nr:T9SS type A sorting domain-containing protein [Fluviicola sp.]